MRKKAACSRRRQNARSIQPHKPTQQGEISSATPPTAVDAEALLTDLRGLIHSARQRIATVANAATTLMCWHVGRRLLRENLQEGRGAYGKQILATLSQQLSWSHFHALVPIKDPLARDFFAEMCRIERWDVRTLRQKIGGMLFQRTALSRKPQAGVRRA